MSPSPAALAAAEEIFSTTFDTVMSMEHMAAIIDRHTAPKPHKLPRYFRDESYTYEWDGATMWLNNPREASVLFRDPEDLMSATDAYETDAYGRKLAPEPEGGEG